MAGALGLVITTDVPMSGQHAQPVYVDDSLPIVGPSRACVVTTGEVPQMGGPAIPVRLAPAGTPAVGPALPVYVVSGSLGSSAPAAPSSLLTGLVAYWKLDEGSGTRVDSTGRGNDLTPTNTPGNATGKVSNAAQFVEASAQDLHRANNADMQIGDNTATIVCWAYLDTKTSERTVLCKYGGAAALWEYGIRYNSGTDRYQFLWAKDAALTLAIATASTFGSPSLATWYFIVVQHDPATDLIKISVNNGAFDTAATAGGFNTNTINFTMGARGSGGANYMDGRIDEVGKWTRLLSAAELTTLYNGGAGLTYPF